MEVPGKRIESDEEENAENVDIVCEPCQSENITTQANGFCKDCEEFMCNTCFRKHLNLKLCKHHVLVDSDLSFLSLQRSDGCKISCKQHIGETVKYYCRTHEVVGCGDCIILEHKTCQLELIQDLSDNFQENTEYKSLKENTDQVIYERKCFEKEILDNKKDNEVMLKKAVGSIKQFRLDINEYLDKVESVVIAKAKNIMKENETLLIKIENECKTLSVKLEKITSMLNSELFKDNALFIHAVECKPKVSESAMALSDMKAKTMKKYEFVPDQQLRSLSNTAKNLGTVAISFMNVCHQTTERANDEDSEQKLTLSESSSELIGKGVYKTETERPVPAPGESLHAEDKKEEQMPPLPPPRQTVMTNVSDSQLQKDSEQKPALSKSRSYFTGKGVYKTETEGPVPAPGESLHAQDKKEERMPPLPSPRQTVTTNISDSQIQSQEKDSEQKPALSKSSSELTGKGVYKTETEGPVPAPGESLHAEDKKEERMPPSPLPRQTVMTNVSGSQLQKDSEQEPVLSRSSSELTGKGVYKTVTEGPVSAPGGSWHAQDKKEERMPPLPSRRQTVTTNVSDSQIQSPEKGEKNLEQEAPTPPPRVKPKNKQYKMEHSERVLLRKDEGICTEMKQWNEDGKSIIVPSVKRPNMMPQELGQDKKEDSKRGSKRGPPSSTRQNGTKNNLDINLECQERGGIKDSGEMIPEKTEVSEENTPKPDYDENTNKNVPEKKTSMSIRVKLYEDDSTLRLCDVVLKDTNDYLKWKYLIHNESASKKIKNQQLRVENGAITVQLKNKLPGQAVEDEIKICLSKFIKAYKGLFVACFEASGQADTIFGDLKQSKMVEKQDLYVYKISQKILFVCSDKDIELVDQEFKQALEKSKADYGGHFQIDFCCEPEQTVLFDQVDVQKFETVEIEYTDDFRKRPYKCTIKGQKLSKLAEAKHELLCTFDKYAYGSISFEDIKNINLIQYWSIPYFLSSELNVKSDLKGILFKVCGAEKRVLVAGPTQAVVDTFIHKVKKIEILRQTFKNVALFKTDILKYESEYKGRLFIEWLHDKCICIGNRKLIEVVVRSLRNPGGKKAVEIEVFETYEFIKKYIETVINPQMFNVTVEAKQENGKFGFIIEGSVDKNIEDCEKHIRSMESKVKNKKISISHQAYYTETAQDLEQKYMILLKEMNFTTVPCNSRKTKYWTLEKGHALKLSCAAARSCWKHLYVDMKMAEKGRGFSYTKGLSGDNILAEMFIPEYLASDGRQTHDLHDTVKNLLHFAKEHDCIHTCIPMDKGLGWPFTKFAKPIISAIIEFLKQSAGELPTEVELCVEDGGDFDTLNERISKALSDKEMAYETESGGGKLEIKLVKGKLDEVQTDVIVNTTARDLQLNIGSVSQSLVNKAGEELQKECVKKYPKGIKDSKIALTKGYKLDCSHVLHVALDHYDCISKHSEQKMEEYVMDCLEITNFLGHKKVSFPALGTGSLGYPPDLVADIMLKSIRNYEKKLGDANVIQEVEIVLQSPDLCSMFEAKKKIHKQREKFSSEVASISKHITCSGMIVDAQCISLDDCRKADVLLVFWDEPTLMSVSKNNNILQEMGEVAAKQFFVARDRNKKDQKAFSTIGGLLKNRIVYHIPFTHQHEFLQSLREGIRKADQEESYSLAVILGSKGLEIQIKHFIVVSKINLLQ